MSAVKITLVSGDDGDWIGMYVDGELKAEGHSLSERRVLEVLKSVYEFEVEGITTKIDDRLPQRLSRVPR